MSGNTVFCFLDENGLPVAVSETNPLPLADANAVPSSDTPNVIYGTDSGGTHKEYPTNAADGVVVADGTGKIPASLLPPLDHEVGEAATEAAMLALAVNAPAVCIRTDFTPPHVFYLTADPASTLANWVDTGEFGAGAANPSALIGLTAKNGATNTFMRSDAAPGIDPAILTSTGESNKIMQTDGGGGFALDDSTNRTEYSAAAIFMYGTPNGNWIDIDASSMEIDLTGNAGTIHIGQSDGIDTGDKPITTSHEAAQPNELVNKALLDSSVAGVVKQVGADAKSAQTANVNAPAVYAVPASGTYRVSAYVVVTQAATTSCVVPSVTVNYTEATTGIVVGDILFNTSTTNQVGSHITGSVVIQAQQNSDIGYVTSNYASVGATPMQYQVRVVIERLL